MIDDIWKVAILALVPGLVLVGGVWLIYGPVEPWLMAVAFGGTTLNALGWWVFIRWAS